MLSLLQLPARGVQRLLSGSPIAVLLALLWSAGILLDAFTTLDGMHSGASTEGNPVAAALMGRVGVLNAVVLASAWSVLLAVPSLARPHGSYQKAAVWTLRVVMVVKLAVGISNLLLLNWGVVLPWSA